MSKQTQTKGNNTKNTVAGTAATPRKRTRTKKPRAVIPAKVITVSNQPGPKAITGKGKYKAVPVETLPWYEQLGRDVGGFLGKAGHGLFKSLTGFGDYTVNSNSLLAEATSGANGSVIPMMINSKVSNIFRHREFIGNVRGTTADFNLQTYDVNPGLDEVFPWGFALANCYTSYRLRGLVFEYISLSSEYTSTPYMGYVAMGSQYNVLDATFADRKSLLNSEYSCSTKPSKNLMHPIECSPAQLPFAQLMVRNGQPPVNSDKRLYDLCRFSIATGGQASIGIIGELWATYEIELYQPKLIAQAGSLVNSDHWRGTCVTGALNGATQMPGCSLNTTIPVSPGNILQFPASVSGGTYLIEYVCQGSTAGNTMSWFADGTKCTLVQNSFSSFPAATQTVSPYMWYTARVKISGEGAQMSVTSSITSGTWDLYITQLPSELGNPPDDAVVVPSWYAQDLMRKEREEYVDTLKQARVQKAIKENPRVLGIKEEVDEFFVPQAQYQSYAVSSDQARTRKTNTISNRYEDDSRSR